MDSERMNSFEKEDLIIVSDTMYEDDYVTIGSIGVVIKEFSYDTEFVHVNWISQLDKQGNPTKVDLVTGGYLPARFKLLKKGEFYLNNLKEKIKL